MTDRPTDITLPEDWTWERVEEQRAKWGISDNMIPVATAPGVVAWGTINSARMEALPVRLQLLDPDDDEDMFAEVEGEGDGCTSPTGHKFVCTGTQYGGDDESYHGEGRCYCVHCGADGDA